MFGDRYFGPRVFGNRYFGPKAGSTPAPEFVVPIPSNVTVTRRAAIRPTVTITKNGA